MDADLDTLATAHVLDRAYRQRQRIQGGMPWLADSGGRPNIPRSALTRIRVNTDRGSQYTSIRFTERLAEAGIQPSVGAVGSSYDNALAETINGLYKTELIKPRKPWRTIEEVELATAEWVDWFNHRRLYEYCGASHPSNWRPPTTLNTRDQPPAEFSDQKVSGLTGAIPTLM